MPKFLSPLTVRWLALIFLVAIILRVYAIDRLPPGLFGDETVEGIDALDVLAGNYFIWFHAYLGREPIYVYLVAASYRFLDVSPFATRLPALIIGLLTLPATFFFTREWARHSFAGDSSVDIGGRGDRLALITTGLFAISFWAIQMNRNAHRDNLVPLVEATGYYFLWRALRTSNWKFFAATGTILGLAIYTYSPGRFVGVFIATFFAIEFILSLITHYVLRNPQRAALIQKAGWTNIAVAAACALLVMLPLGIYFGQNPAQFFRRFDSTSVLNAAQPLAALSESAMGNLLQFVVPGAGYQSKHYNVPGKPIFDLFLAPWFLAGLVIAFARIKKPAYRFLLLWFVVMLFPAFLTSDMIPKGVRGFGVMPGALVFIALAMDGALQRFKVPTIKRYNVSTVLVSLTFIASTAWTTYDYFITWSNLPDLPIAFDVPYAETAYYVRSLPQNVQPFVSAEVYRQPTFTLLAEQIPTTRYYERATRVREFDATTLLVNAPNAVTIFVRDQSPAEDWYRRMAPKNERITGGKYFAAYHLRDLALPQAAFNNSFNPFVSLVGISSFADDPPGVALYWRIAALPEDRTEMKGRVTLLDARGQVIAQKEHRFGYPPLEWSVDDRLVEWYEFDSLDNATQFSVDFTRGDKNWQSSPLQLQ